MTEFELTRTINAPKEKIWDALQNFGEISRWNPGVIESHSTTEAVTGLGAERRCELGRGQWVQEKIVGWEDGKSLDIKIIATNAPLSHAIVTISVEALDPMLTRATVNIDYKLKYGPVGALVNVLMGKRAYRKAMNELLAGLKYYSETGEDVGNELPA